MNIYIVTDSTNYEPRAWLIGAYYSSKGHNVKLVESDFDHRRKQRIDERLKKTERTDAKRQKTEQQRTDHPDMGLYKAEQQEKEQSDMELINTEQQYKGSPDTGLTDTELPGKGRSDTEASHIYIHAGAYQKNISVKRLKYHSDFAKQAYRLLKNRDIDLLYVLIPGNSLAKMAARLKKEKGCRLVIDVIDLWPESFPLKGFAKLPPALYWKDLRDRYLNCADHIVTECELYRQMINADADKTSVIYWPKREAVELFGTLQHIDETAAEDRNVDSTGSEPNKKTDEAGTSTPEYIDIAYLGSINNIIDIPEIIKLLKAIEEDAQSGRVRLSIIGDGEKREDFLEALKDAGIEHTYHGAIFDEQKKQAILQQCRWGLNIMKPEVVVGLTMKSVDYLANGLKLINSIKGDTWEMVEKNDLGVNVGYLAETANANTVLSDRSDNQAEDYSSDHRQEKRDPYSETAKYIAEADKSDRLHYIRERERIHAFYEENFSVEAMYRELENVESILNHLN